jgi:hypothetical protein
MARARPQRRQHSRNFRHAWVPRLPPRTGPIWGLGRPSFLPGDSHEGTLSLRPATGRRIVPSKKGTRLRRRFWSWPAIPWRWPRMTLGDRLPMVTKVGFRALNRRCRRSQSFGSRCSAKTGANGGVAPIPAILWATIEPPKSTQMSRLRVSLATPAGSFRWRQGNLSATSRRQLTTATSPPIAGCSRMNGVNDPNARRSSVYLTPPQEHGHD